MTSTNLLPLLNQLQMMENTLSNFMLETILKLQTLTDVKVFFLVETSQKRRFCGSEDLIGDFQTGNGLRCSAQTDTAVTLNSSMNSLIESIPYVGTNDVISTDRENRDKSFSFEPQNSWEYERDRNSSTASELDGPTSAKRKRRNGSRSTHPALTANVESDIKLDCVVIDEEDDLVAPVSSLTASFLEDGVADDVATDGISHGDAFSANIDSDKTSNPSMEPFSFFDALKMNERDVQKYQALLNVENPMALYQKDTVESKLLNSVCYSIGKSIGLKCPLPFTQQNRKAVIGYWSRYCDLFVAECANAGLLVEKNAENAASLDLIPRNSAVGHIRQRIRDGFKEIAKLPKPK